MILRAGAVLAYVWLVAANAYSGDLWLALAWASCFVMAADHSFRKDIAA